MFWIKQRWADGHAQRCAFLSQEDYHEHLAWIADNAHLFAETAVVYVRDRQGRFAARAQGDTTRHTKD